MQNQYIRVKHHQNFRLLRHCFDELCANATSPTERRVQSPISLMGEKPGSFRRRKRSLFDLPDEIIDHIVGFHASAELKELCLVSRRIRDHAVGKLWRSVGAYLSFTDPWWCFDCELLETRGWKTEFQGFIYMSFLSLSLIFCCMNLD